MRRWLYGYDGRHRNIGKDADVPVGAGWRATLMPWLDVALGLTLCVTATLALTTGELFRAVVMFIVFGLMMALVWVRLDAPDIALAEAAIGAGLTGVLLLDTLGYLRGRSLSDQGGGERGGDDTT